ncbi:MAG: arsenate reductase family protein [Bdellovibrionales bacterium]|nr:arsenate reductase family protein [Bdellovibrionales bacterium]
MKLYVHPRCTTCKKALAFLEKQKISVEPIDITVTPPNKRELKQMLGAYGGDIRRLFNTSGMQYREFGLKDRLDTMSEAEALELLRQNGMLVRRPFLLLESGGLVGFREPEWKNGLARKASVGR